MTDDRGHDPLDRAIAMLREPVAIAPDLDQRVLRRRQMRVRRARATAFGAVTLAMFLIVMILAQRGTRVTFSIVAPGGSSVALVGDFTDWRSDRVQLQRASNGAWQATVRLAPGRYRYAYVIDRNLWRADSGAAPAPDDFGRPTSVVTVVSN